MDISRDNPLWLQFWRDQRTDFHQQAVNQLLTRFWPNLESVAGSRVFVPLCGKSLDMLWLAEQGHDVIGVELSPVAVKAFFRENSLKPSKRRVGNFMLWKAGRISILCGDYFSLLSADLGVIDVVYDRAALTALPEDIRKRYVAHLSSLLPKSCKVLLLTAEDVEKVENLSAALNIDAEISALFANEFVIDLLHVESVADAKAESLGLLPELTEYKVYQLVALQILHIPSI